MPTSRERIIAALRHQTLDRIPIDHSVPPTISFDVYRQAVEWIKKYGSY